jgi:hypothetical protein
LTLHVVFSIQRHLNCSWIGLKLHNGRMPLPYRTSRYPAQKLGPSFPQRPLSQSLPYGKSSNSTQAMHMRYASLAGYRLLHFAFSLAWFQFVQFVLRRLLFI